MGEARPKRPRPARFRKLPPDALSLVQLFRGLHRNLCIRANHLKQEPHDLIARRGFLLLHQMRWQTWQKLKEMDSSQAYALAREFDLKTPGLKS